VTGAAASADAAAAPRTPHFRTHTWAGLPRGDQATLTSASVSAPMAPSFFPRRLCRPTCRAHRAGCQDHTPAILDRMQGVQDTVCKTLGLPIRPLIAPDDFS
jgi:hypothetical protein